MITTGSASGQEQISSLSSLSHMNAFYGMLAQLSFVREAPEYADDGHLQGAADNRDSGFLDALNGCFCFSLDQEDWFYDAVQRAEDMEDFSIIREDDDNQSAQLQKSAANDEPHKAVSRGGCQASNSFHEYSEQSIEIQKSQTMEIQQSQTMNGDDNDSFKPLPPPPPPKELPLRFLRAGKGDPVEGRRRYEATLQWRKENDIDHILTSPHPNFELIKKHYPHYYHLRGHHGEPVFFEQPPKTNLQAMKNGGVTLEGLLRHYAMVTEFQWQFIERDDLARSITVLDLEGMRMMDFVGECVEYVKKCSAFTGQHYPERAGYVLVVNVPGWFQMIWRVVRPMVDEVTLNKINILRGKSEVLEALKEKIPLENIPPEYGGKSMPLGQSPQEILMRDLMRHNNNLAAGDRSCGGRNGGCKFCSFVPARSY